MKKKGGVGVGVVLGRILSLKKSALPAHSGCWACLMGKDTLWSISRI